MLVLLSPSKTKELKGLPTEDVFAPERTWSVVEAVKSWSVAELGKALKIKEEMAERLFDLYQDFDDAPLGMAGASYTGQAFKKFDWDSLSDSAQSFAADHLIILSAMYGVVRPYSPITTYRLDLVDPVKVNGDTPLLNWWKQAVTDYVKSADWVLNLASKEYSQLVDHPRMVTVAFLENKQGEWKQMSTSSKQMRGLLARYVCEHHLTQVQDLPHQIGDFVLREDIPEAHGTFTISYYKS